MTVRLPAIVPEKIGDFKIAPPAARVAAYENAKRKVAYASVIRPIWPMVAAAVCAAIKQAWSVGLIPHVGLLASPLIPHLAVGAILVLGAISLYALYRLATVVDSNVMARDRAVTRCELQDQRKTRGLRRDGLAQNDV